MKRTSIMQNTFPFIRLALLTASVVTMGDYTIAHIHWEPNHSASVFELLRSALGVALFAVAVFAVFDSWAKRQGSLRRWSEGTIGIIVWLEILGVSVVYFNSHLFPEPLPSYPSRHAPLTREQRQYYALESAVTNNDLDRVRGLLGAGDCPVDFEPGIDVEGRFGVDNQPLETAVRAGNVPIAAALLNSGVYPESRFSEAVVIAAENGDVPMLSLLWQRGAKLAPGGNSPALWQAVDEDHLDAATFLLNHGANPNTVCPPDTSSSAPDVLRLAQMHENVALVQLLKQAGAKE